MAVLTFLQQCTAFLRLETLARSNRNISVSQGSRFSRSFACQSYDLQQAEPQKVARWENDGGAQRPSDQATLISTLLGRRHTDFEALCQAQLQVLQTVLGQQQSGGGGPAHTVVATVFARLPVSFERGELHLQQIATSRVTGGNKPFSRTFLNLGAAVPRSGSVQDVGESALIDQEVVNLPGSGSVVLPLSHGQFLVGLLLLERTLANSESSLGQDESRHASTYPTQTLSGEAVFSTDISNSLSLEELRSIQPVSQVLALACAIEQRAALERAEEAMNRMHLADLVDEARGPLTVVRSLGAMLQPRLREGEPARDMADGILVQGAQLQNIVKQLQLALDNLPMDHTQDPILSESRVQADAGACLLTQARIPCRQQHQLPISLAALPLDIEGEELCHRISSQEPSRTCIDRLLQGLVRSLQSTASAMGIDLTAHQHGLESGRKVESRSAGQHVPLRRPLIANLDEELLEEVLTHMLHSAFQRTPRGGMVTISACSIEGGIAIELNDSGFTMASTLAAALHEQCSTALQPESSKSLATQNEGGASAADLMKRLSQGLPGGCGVTSLVLAQNMVCALGGELSISSHEQQGTRVRLFLPDV